MIAGARDETIRQSSLVGKGPLRTRYGVESIRGPPGLYEGSLSVP